MRTREVTLKQIKLNTDDVSNLNLSYEVKTTDTKDAGHNELLVFSDFQHALQAFINRLEG